MRRFFYDTFLSIIHLGKYTDYRSKSQDNHCPPVCLKETNLYYRYLEKLEERWKYLSDFKNNHSTENVEISFSDYRDFFSEIKDGSVDLVLTDPPFGDTAQYFEHAQRTHPFIPYSLLKDTERLKKEVVISNAPSRKDKHGEEQFMRDIETLIMESSRVLKEHGFLAMYFRPKQSSWISNLNQLKHFGRKHELEPLMAISLEINDPSMRALSSAAWTFSKDTCFVFLKLKENECRWYDEDTDIDELVYIAASNAATDQGLPFVITKFNTELQAQLRRARLLKYASAIYQSRFRETLSRFTIRNGAQYMLSGQSPYDFERLIADYFVKRGYVKAETIGGSGDRGVDVLATNIDGKIEFIQCKRYRKGSNIGSTPIQRVDSMRLSRKAEKAWVFTTSDFTPEGIDEARITGVNLVNGDELIKSLDIYYPGKYCL